MLLSPIAILRVAVLEGIIEALPSPEYLYTASYFGQTRNRVLPRANRLIAEYSALSRAQQIECVLTFLGRLPAREALVSADHRSHQSGFIGSELTKLDLIRCAAGKAPIFLRPIGVSFLKKSEDGKLTADMRVGAGMIRSYIVNSHSIALAQKLAKEGAFVIRLRNRETGSTPVKQNMAPPTIRDKRRM